MIKVKCRLVDVLFTDDWGAPPVYVKITGNTTTGIKVDVHISYN